MKVATPHRMLLAVSLLVSIAPADAQPVRATRMQTGAVEPRTAVRPVQRAWPRPTNAQRIRAYALFRAGNERLHAGHYQDALELFRGALEEWDNPAIRLNLARVFIQLGLILQAHENLVLATKYGPAGLSDAAYPRAERDRRLIEAQTAVIEVTCNESGANVKVDGDPLSACPGRAERRYLPGTHRVVVTKDGFITETYDLMVRAGQRETVSVALVRLTRRWAAWKPWAVAAAGVAVVGLGGLVALKAQSDAERFDTALTPVCGQDGCDSGEVPRPLLALEERAHMEHNMAVGMMVSGGIIIAGSVVAVLLNRPRAQRPAAAVRVSVPAGGAGAAIGISVEF